MKQFRSIWPTFRHPNRLFWLNYSSLRLFIYIYIGYSLFLVITSGWLIMRRKHYLFRKNPIGVTIGGVILQWLIGTIHMYRYVSTTPLPAWLIILRNYVLFPLCLLYGVQGRGMHIMFEVLWTKALRYPNTEQDDQLSTSILINTADGRKLVPSGDNRATNGDNGNGGRGRVRRWSRDIKSGSFVKNQMKNPHLYVWLKNQGLKLMLSLFTGLHSGVALLLMIINWDTYFPYHTRRVLGLEDFGLVLSVILYLITWAPLMLYYLSGVKDAYNLRKDLKIGLSYALPCYIIYSCFRGYTFLQPLRMEIPSFIFMLLSMMALHSASVVSPLLRTLFWSVAELGSGDLEERRVERTSPHDVIVRKAENGLPSIVVPHRAMPLEQVLSNPVLAAPFEAYSKSAFVWDSVLFHRAVNTFRERARDDPACLPLESQRIYARYIEVGSPCEMNLSYAIIRKINFQMMPNGTIGETLFDEAQDEVLRLVGNCTYRNFLYNLDPALKARYMIPFGKTLINTIDEEGSMHGFHSGNYDNVFSTSNRPRFSSLPVNTRGDASNFIAPLDTLLVNS